MATLYENFRGPDDAATVTGSLVIIPASMRDSLDGTNTLARLPLVIQVVDGQLTQNGLPPGDYVLHSMSLRTDDGAPVYSQPGDTPAAFSLEDTEAPQRLRTLLALGVVPDSPANTLRAIVENWLEQQGLAGGTRPATWTALKGASRTRRVEVVSIGDSFTSYNGRYGSWPTITAAALSKPAMLDTAFTGTISPRLGGTGAGNWNGYEGDHNPHLVQLLQAGNSLGEGALTFDISGAAGAEVVYWDMDGYYSIPRYSIDGGAAQDLGSPMQLIAANVDTLAPGARWVGRVPGGGTSCTLHPPSGKPNPSALVSMILFGQGDWQNRGIRWTNYAWPGWTLQRWMTTLNFYSGYKDLQAIKPEMLHVGSGGNEMLAGLTPAQIKQGYRDVVAWYTARLGYTPVLFFTTMPYCDITFPDAEWKAQWDAAFDAVVEVGQELGAMVMDCRKVFPKQSVAPELYVSSSDHHMSYAGQQLMGDLVANFLGA